MSKAKSPIFKALLQKRNSVQPTKQSKRRRRNSKLSRKEKRQQLNGD